MRLGRVSPWPSRYRDRVGLDQGELKRIAGLAAKNARMGTLSFHDRKESAYWQILFSLDKIKRANNPGGAAYTIAYRHLVDSYRREEQRFSREQPVSTTHPPASLPENQKANWSKLSTTDKLELLRAGRNLEGYWQSERLQKLIVDVQDALSQLLPMERVIIRGSFGFGGETLTVKKLAALVEKSEIRVKQIKREALGKLRVLLSALGYGTYGT